jgi:quercetin dioxygenase-like cupin family protein
MSIQATTNPTDELEFLGCRVRVLASGEIGVVDMLEVPAGHMPPLHVHHNEGEGFYLLDGELTLFIPGKEVTLRAGEYFSAPRGVPHTYRVGDAPARWLIISSPSGFERFVTEVAEGAITDPAELAETAGRFDIEILGPPGMLP